MKADRQTEAGVMAVVDRLWDAYSTRDIDGVMACFAADPDAVLIGTGADEMTVGPDQIRALFLRDWSQSEAGAMELGWHSVSAAGPVAWFVASCTVHAVVEGQEMHLPARLSAVLERRDGSWLIVQLHGSLPAAGQAEGEAWPSDPS